jgi:SAM-dependent methyltransferase
MDERPADRAFTGSIPELYDTQLVPLIFEPYAQDLARRLAALGPRRVLEIAAGTGVVTRAMAATLPRDTAIVASDLNPAMLERAATVGCARAVEWRQADAMALPFDDASFDAVVCQFGAMFFPDKGKAFNEARRVLAPGGSLLFNVWDRIEDNEFADVVTAALAPLYPEDPPRFLARTPHGYHDRDAIARDLAAGGFEADPRFTTLAERSNAASARIAARAYCEGTPLRNEIESRPSADLAAATLAATEAIAQRFGHGPVDGKIQAIIVAIGR